MKKVLSFVGILVLLVVSLGSPVFADRHYNSDDYIYEIEHYQVEIIRYLGNQSVIVVPETIDNMPVSKIGEKAFGYHIDLTSISLPSTCKEIDEEAFKDCINLSTVSLNDGLNKIEEKAFYGCPSLKQINIPASVKKIDKKAFNRDSGLIITAPAGSYAERYAIENGFTSSNQVNSNPTNVPLRDIDIVNDNLRLNAGETVQIQLRFKPENATNKNVRFYSSNPTVAQVSETGLVTALAGGRAEITVVSEDGNHDDDCDVIVTGSNVIPNPGTGDIRLRDVDIVNSKIGLRVGETTQIQLRFKPENATNKNVTYYSSNPNVAQVSETGLVTARAVGITEITVVSQDGGHDDDCKVVVSDSTITPNPGTGNVRDIKLNRDDIYLEINQTFQLTATLIPEGSTANLIWISKNPSVATVDETGLVRAVGTGKTEIEVMTTDGRIDDDCDVRVGSISNPGNPSVPVREVNLDRGDLYLNPDESVVLKASVFPKDATNQNLIWMSSNVNVATVDQNGKVTAVGIGKAEIIVITEDGHHDDDCDVIVSNPDITGPSGDVPVRDIDVEDDLYLDVGATYKLNVFISPSNASNQQVSYQSLNPAIATVDQNGLITAIASGKTLIRVTSVDGGHTDTCSVHVGETVSVLPDPGVIPVRDIDIDDYVTLEVGQTKVLNVRITPINATNQTVKWSSSNEQVVSVTQDGEITALKAGTAEIRVITEDGLHDDDCDVIVVNPSQNTVAVESVYLNSTKIALESGKSLTLEAGVIPSYATSQNLVWSSSDERVVTVENGKVQAVSTGEAKVYATSEDGQKTAECIVTVIGEAEEKPQETPVISYTVHVQDIGWQNEVKNGEQAGTTGLAKRLEGIKINLSQNSGDLKYQTHVEDIGWQDWKSNGELAGTTGQAKRLEAIKINLSGELGASYDIYYRVHCENIGWLNWAKNGAPAGSAGFAQRLEAIQIQLVPKGATAPICQPANNSELCFVEK